MQGDDRVRYCAECKLNVYDFSALTAREIEQLVTRTEGRLCGRLYKRPDGTLLTADCPIGFRTRVRRLSRAAAAAFSALTMGISAAAAQKPRTSPSTTSLVQIDPFTSGLVVQVNGPGNSLLPFARVWIVNEKGEIVSDGLTNSHGRFVVTDLGQGSYVIEVESVGLETAVLRKVSFPRAGVLQVQMHAMGRALETPNQNHIQVPFEVDMGWVISPPFFQNIKPPKFEGDDLTPPHTAPSRPSNNSPEPNFIKRLFSAIPDKVSCFWPPCSFPR